MTARISRINEICAVIDRASSRFQRFATRLKGVHYVEKGQSRPWLGIKQSQNLKGNGAAALVKVAQPPFLTSLSDTIQDFV
jgi:hypothetical protein